MLNHRESEAKREVNYYLKEINFLDIGISDESTYNSFLFPKKEFESVKCILYSLM